MICFFCRAEISADQLHHHHLVPLADGGPEAGAQVLAHAACHHQHHRDNGDYRRWTKATYKERVAMFGADEVRRLLSFWGRQGWTRLVEKRGPGYLAEFHRRGGLARGGPQSGTRRDARGRFVAVGTRR